MVFEKVICKYLPKIVAPMGCYLHWIVKRGSLRRQQVMEVQIRGHLRWTCRHHMERNHHRVTCCMASVLGTFFLKIYRSVIYQKISFVQSKRWSKLIFFFTFWRIDKNFNFNPPETAWSSSERTFFKHKFGCGVNCPVMTFAWSSKSLKLIFS